MRLSRTAWLACLLNLALPGPPPHAMQFEQVQTAPTEVIVGGRGPIVQGDTARLNQALASVPKTQRLLALALDSPGGLVDEGVQLAAVIRTRQLAVIIPSNSQCVSACFLLLAASPHRLAAADALVGVHSANENQQETGMSLAVTTLMAREAAKDGIPAAIVGKMVETTPGRVEWLTQADLTSMNVTLYNGDPQTAARQTPPPSAAPTTPTPATTPTPTAAPTQANTPSDLTTGRNDRRAWDFWFAGLRGPYRDGAAFALTQLGLPQPGSCYGPNGANRGDFTLGCQVARQRLARAATGLRGNADYAAGWNGTTQPKAPTDATEAEYRGAYFCGRQVARLSLKLFPPTGAPRQRAMFSFGPEATSPNVPHGAFIVEGVVDLHGGAMTLTPVTWVSQPPGYAWLGLSGRSDDGGKTFSGRVTDSSACTIFTLQRVTAATATR